MWHFITMPRRNTSAQCVLCIRLKSKRSGFESLQGVRK
jgi:hypothetical protein